MTDTDGPFDGKPWAEAQWARHAAAWAPSGVYGPPAASTTTGDLPLSVSGLSVGVGAGRAWVRGFGFERTGAALMQAVTANTHGSFNRRDRIVLRRNLATHTITPVPLTGIPAASPTAPALTQSDAGSWDLPLFSFLIPPNSGTAISGIVDERAWLDETTGGLVPQLIAEAPSAALVGSGAAGSGAGYVLVASIAVPAHRPGLLRCRFVGAWTAPANSAAFAKLQFPAGTDVPGSMNRGRNNGVANVPVPVNCEGPIRSDGTARTLGLYVSTDAAAETTLLSSGSFQVWLT